VIVGVTGTLLLVFRRHFSGLERDRLQQIKESEGRLQTLLANSLDMILVLDASGVPRFIAGAFQRITGYTIAEGIGFPGFERLHPDDDGRVRRIFADLARAPGAVVRAEWRQQHRDGRWCWLEAIATNCLSVPGVNGVVVNIRDVTERTQNQEERKRLEEKLQQASKMESIGRLAGGVAHDFNNLLTAVLGNTELAVSQPGLDPAVRDALGEIRQAGQSAVALTRQLLAFSRRQIIEPRSVNLNDLINTMQRLLTRLIGEHITLATELAPDLGSVQVDPGLVEQIVVNLAVNARDAMPDGGTLRIHSADVQLTGADAELRPLIPPGSYILLAVSDTGVGMSAEVKRHLFEPFFTTKPQGQGTGLGLAMVYGAVSQSQGYIEVDSEPGRGATFRIFFPRAAGEAFELAAAKEAPAPPRGSETILLVEDERQVRDLTQRALTRLGYRVLAAADGSEALRVAGGRPIDLLLTDVVMPGMNGRQLAAELVRSHPGTRGMGC